MRLLHILSALSILTISSCDQGGNSVRQTNDRIIETDNFSVINMSTSGRMITDDADLLGIVSSIELVGNKYIAVCQNRADAHVSIYNLMSDSTFTVMTRGEGPNEMLRVSTMSSDDDGNLWLAGLMDRKIMKVGPTENNSLSTILSYRLPDDFLRGVADYDGGIIGLPGGHHESRIIHVASNGLAIDSMTSFPPVEMPAGATPNNFIFQSDIAYSHVAGKIALACKSWNYINIIDLKTKEEICLNFSLDEPIKLEKYEVGEAVGYHTKPFWLMFSGVEATSDSFFVGYVGVKVNSPDDISRNARSILEFDWNGNPLRKLDFTNEVVAFSLSDNGKVLYTVENNPDPVLYEYKL